MLAVVIAFICGAGLVLGLASLPGAVGLALLAAAAALCARAGWRLPCALLCGFLLAAGHGRGALARDWPCERDREQVEFDATVLAPAVRWPGRLDLELGVGAAERARGLPPRLRLSWYEPTALPQPGERWAFSARLRCRSGLANPGGHDRELSLLRAGIGATGYVSSGSAPLRRAAAGWRAPLERARSAVALGIDAATAEGRSSGVLQGLSVGLRATIPDDLEAAFAATGTAHLIAISGMHVTAFALVLLWASRGLFRWLATPAWSGRWPLAQAGLVLALTAGYALLAGASVPTVRTAVMVALALAVRLARRHAAGIDVLALAALLLVAADPLVVSSVGFWLSFVAVAALLQAGDPARGGLRVIRAFTLAQAVVTLALTPVLLAAFNAVSLVSPLANAIAIPFFSFVLLPLTLLGLALTPLWPAAADATWRGLAALLDACWPPLLALAAQPWAVLHPPAAPAWLVLAALVAALAAVLLPAGVFRIAAFTTLAALLLRAPDRPAAGAFELTVLDVGQGLATVLRTARHTMVFDSGPGWRGGGSAARYSIIPFLRAQGLRRIDTLVISHDDLDHSGGAAELLAAFAPQTVLGPARIERARPCVVGESWRWDGVSVTVIHPRSGETWGKNDGSCALLVEGAGGRALLLADPESRAEQAMLADRREQLAADLVLVPHHGSASSSSTDFVRAVAPRVALVSAGFGNRWGMPRAEVVERWQAAGATVFSTASQGALTVLVDPVLGPGAVRAQRVCSPRWWHRPGRAGRDAGRLSCAPHVGDHPGRRPSHVADPSLLGRGSGHHSRAAVDPAGKAGDSQRAHRPRRQAGRDPHPD